MAAPKLNADARRLVIERIIAGYTNNEIRQALSDAGYPFNIADQAFSHYRAHGDVKDAIARKDEEAVQSGYAQRSERILKLALSAKRFETMLAVEPGDTKFSPSKPIITALVHKEYRETLKDIGALVDPAKVQPLTLNATIEVIASAADSADARFAAIAGRNRSCEVLGGADDA